MMRRACFLTLQVLFLAACALAMVPYAQAQTAYKYRGAHSSNLYAYQSTPQASCEYHFTKDGTYFPLSNYTLNPGSWVSGYSPSERPLTAEGSNGPRWLCTVTTKSSGETSPAFTIYRYGSACPAGTEYDSQTGACDAVPTCPSSGTEGPTFDFISGWRTGPATGAPSAGGTSSAPQTLCSNSCSMNVNTSATVVDTQPSANGYYAIRTGVLTSYTGQTCTNQTTIEDAAPPSTPPPEKNRCPEGTMATGVDESGITICSGTGEKPNAPPPVTETTTKTENPDGSTTETTVEEVTNSDGSKTTTTTTKTTGADGSVTIESSSSTSDTPGGEDGKDDRMKDFCEKNPQLNICKNSEITGDCPDNISCKGDAIQCAIARQVAEQNCKYDDEQEELKASSHYALGGQLLSGDDPMQSQFPTVENGESFNIASVQVTSQSFLGAGSCFADTYLPVLGLTFSWSAICENILALRYAIMAAALMLAARMLKSTILGV